MPNFIYITLDTQAPANPLVKIAGGAVFTTAQLVNLLVTTDDVDKTGYQMLIWGDVDPAYNVNVQKLETESKWTAFNSSPQIKLSSQDGQKTINVRIRDDVHNASSLATAMISLDMSLPTVTVTNPDLNRISKNVDKDTFSFTFSSNEAFSEYKVKLVSSTGSGEAAGSVITTTHGSLNTIGSTGNYTAGQVITVTVKGEDLVLSGASTDGQKIIKVFVKDLSGQWSV